MSLKGKIVDLDVFDKILKNYKTLRVVQCHGVFDLLHIGHIRHFQEAKKQGDILVVTITPDHYVNKGPGRPRFTAILRAEAIASLDCVDFVIINTTPTAVEAIQRIKPHVYAKGSEYSDPNNDITTKILNETEAVKLVGGKVVFTDDITFSSSSLINKFFPPFSEEVGVYLDKFKQKYNMSSILGPLKQSEKLNILVIGETIIDIYHFSEVIGKAGKEPTLVAKEHHNKTYAGGVLALANHLSDFCKQVTCLTYLGENAEYEDIIKTSLKPNIKMVVIYKKDSPTIVKRRYIEEYLRQKLFEVYEINDDFLEDSQNELLQEYLHSLLSNHDLTIVADYGHGLLDEKPISILTEKAKFLAVNTQSNAGNNGFNCISKYSRADFVAIATRELQLNYRQKHLSVPEQLQRLILEHDYQNVVITGGSKGIYVGKKRASIHHTPAFVNTVVDRVGAGDAVFAISAIFAYQNVDPEIIGFIGNVVGAEAVGIMGNERYIEKIALMKHISHLLK
ncbi:MAG: hypothetical protein A3E83_06610 [Gammaproteobacteria bacterium RIFCSPHIGHO2_12_FULL_41_20]|nr:MAG: hypothetical protein A3E83_06610 [Gammaproteobacteria bacterium RIFCSPHIGHO2_12_FULL_41_20]